VIAAFVAAVCLCTTPPSTPPPEPTLINAAEQATARDLWHEVGRARLIVAWADSLQPESDRPVESRPVEATGSRPSPPGRSAPVAGVWDELAQCESGGDWAINTGNGYTGGLQFLDSTWDAYGGEEFAPMAYQASRAEQITVAERLRAQAGFDPWPTCSRRLGL